MKRVLYLLPLVLLVFSGCFKDKQEPEIIIDPFTYVPGIRIPATAGNLVSSWNIYETYASIGTGEINWMRDSTSKTSIQFYQDFRYVSNKNYKNTYKIDAFAIDTILTVYKKGTTDSSRYLIRALYTDSLILGTFDCIEGCGEKYIRDYHGLGAILTK